MLIILTLLLPLFLSSNGESGIICRAQTTNSDWLQYYEMIADEYTEDGEEDELEQIYEIMSEVASSPLNLNAISQEDLENLICFSKDQIDAILNYVNRYAPLQTKAELLMIPYLDTARRGLLHALTYLGEAPVREKSFLDSLKYSQTVEYNHRQFHSQQSKGDATIFTRIPLYTRKGDGNAYQGGKIKNWFRTNYSINNHIKVGAVAAQDAGEPFFKSPNHLGYDFYSGYVQLQKYGALKKLIVGRYRIKSGLGLILNNNYSFGKLFSLSSLQSSAVSLRPHSSRSEGNYLQGAAASFSLSKNLEATIFGSYREIDATLATDGQAIATILHTGYHRTESEIKRRHNASQTSAGANIRWNSLQYHIGATALINHYSLPLVPYTKGSSISQLYKMHYATGQNFWNASIDYGYKLGKRIRFEGETATGDCNLLATVNTISWHPNNKLSLSAIQRYYPYKFYSTMGRSFSEGGMNQNESGIYVGGTWNPNSQVSLTAYTDIAYFAWPKYQALGASHSFDNLLQLSVLTSKSSSLTARYRIHLREKNGNEQGELIYKDEQRLRVTYNKQDGKLTWKSQIDVAYCNYKEDSWGAMISSNASYSLNKAKISAGAGYFNTQNYNSRVYAYEQSTPYNLSFPSFYGKGMRLYALAQTEIIKKLSLIAKCGMTHYFDRNTIGSSYQLINSSTQTDIDLMLRYAF